MIVIIGTPTVGLEVDYKRRKIRCTTVELVPASHTEPGFVATWETPCYGCKKPFTFRTRAHFVPVPVCRNCVKLPRAKRPAAQVVRELVAVNTPPVGEVVAAVAALPPLTTVSLDKRAVNWPGRILRRKDGVMRRYSAMGVAAGVEAAIKAGVIEHVVIGFDRWRRPVKGLRVVAPVEDDILS